MRTLKRNSGQFVPISAMIMFTMVIFMIAMVNVFKVSRAKLKVQNMADAVALNLASQEAQAFNVVADRNEWMNHMLAGADSPSDPRARGDLQDCTAFNERNRILIPGISCVENTGVPDLGGSPAQVQKLMSRHLFHSQDGAANYASLIQTINEAQFLFVQAYNSFLGVRSGSSSGSSTAAPANFEGLLKKDIPDLNDPSFHLITWNSRKEPNTH